jgi:hypothetical protein
LSKLKNTTKTKTVPKVNIPKNYKQNILNLKLVFYKSKLTLTTTIITKNATKAEKTGEIIHEAKI